MKKFKRFRMIMLMTKFKIYDDYVDAVGVDDEDIDDGSD